ncbi:hypothetical protein [Haloplasma contractile]|uniref:Uncharacterized protein n=1 Tax=Haloplasma contractile SSD-17B TaxID=1033810 RepID=U2E864_9MOLU|nr:hypothetical protein [Haloplasma contractile]ERJ11071.1 hypothetical protein HLPCO_002892 [Haloplasma contractile SSD-17B]
MDIYTLFTKMVDLIETNNKYSDENDVLSNYIKDWKIESKSLLIQTKKIETMVGKGKSIDSEDELENWSNMNTYLHELIYHIDELQENIKDICKISPGFMQSKNIN